MTRKLIVANWKLNPLTAKEAVNLASVINVKAKHTVVLCPPHIFLTSVTYPKMGAQDCFWQDKGAYTGQVSPAQLAHLKIKYCIVGHSERRGTGDSDEMVNAKVKALLQNKIIPILCVGFGTTVEQDDLEVVDVLKSQLEKDLAGVEPSKVIVAYEPVWAIGTGKNATPEHAEQMAIYIKSKYNVSKVLYGASVNVGNARKFLEQLHVDGLLVGGTSLIAEHFNQIINF